MGEGAGSDGLRGSEPGRPGSSDFVAYLHDICVLVGILK